MLPACFGGADMRHLGAACLAALLLAGAVAGRHAAHRPERGPRRAGPGPRRQLRRPRRVRRGVRQAGRHRRAEQFRAAARHGLGLVAGQSRADRDAARRGEVPRRPGDGRRCGEGQPGALPQRAGKPAQGRTEAGVVGGGGRSAHGAAASVAALCAAGRRAGGPRRHDDLAQGARPRRDGGPAVRRAVQADRARGAGPHRGGSLRRLLERRMRSSWTASSISRSPTPPCDWSICRRASSTWSSGWGRPTSRR